MVAHSFNPLRGNRSVSLLSSDFNSEKKNEFKIEKSMNRAICPFFPFSFFSFPFTLPSLVKIYLFIFQSVQIQISSTCPLSQRKVCSLRFVEFSRISILISQFLLRRTSKRKRQKLLFVYMYILNRIYAHIYCATAHYSFVPSNGALGSFHIRRNSREKSLHWYHRIPTFQLHDYWTFEKTMSRE